MANENTAVKSTENTPETTASAASTTPAATAPAPASTEQNVATPSDEQTSVETTAQSGKKGKKGGAKGGNSVAKVTDLEERMKALETTLGKLTKDFGEGAVIKLGQSSNIKVEVVPTGILSIDAALGVGGLPKGRIVEIYGPESSGKTTLALHAIAACQKAGGTAAFIDAEHAMDPVYCEKLGVDINELYVSQPDTGEQALDIAEALVRSGAIDIVVIDSVAALVPKAEIEGDMGDSHVGIQARLMSQALRKLTGVVSNTQCIVIFINQLREKVGITYGNPEVTSGGKALKFYATIRIDVRKSEAIKDGKEIVGNRTKIKIVKNKVAPPFKTVVVDMLYGEGISRVGDMLDIAVNMEVIKKSGSFYSLNPKYFGVEDRIGQGRDNARLYLTQHPEWADKVETVIREQMAAGKSVGKDDSSSGSSSSSVSAGPVDLDDDDDDFDGENGSTQEFVVDTAPGSASSSSASAPVSTDSADDKAYWDNELELSK